jgi:hypothetical protein
VCVAITIHYGVNSCGATVVAPFIIASVGALQGAAGALFFQSVCVVAAVWSVLLGTSNGSGDGTSSTSSRSGNDGITKGGVGGGPAVLMLAVAASRFGLWAFDLAERQLVQRQTTADGTVRECDRALLFNWERSLCDGMYVVRAPVTPMVKTRMYQCPTRTCIRARQAYMVLLPEQSCYHGIQRWLPSCVDLRNTGLPNICTNPPTNATVRCV